ncbi:hypothetical protein H8356DRAFT_1417525 [Neocallimastix lanati (nom. inval.)]|nr:hypothetical protein H8356DRAFT_1417525 [Neocallimastix sp. JGI-2020a]
MSTISLQNTSANNKNKLTSKGEDSGSVLQPVLVPQLGYSAIQNVLEINKKLIKVLIEYQNYGWIEDPDFIIYQRRLQTNLNYLATVADNYLNFEKINIPDLSPVNISDKLKMKMEEKENDIESTNLSHTNNNNINNTDKSIINNIENNNLENINNNPNSNSNITTTTTTTTNNNNNNNGHDNILTTEMNSKFDSTHTPTDITKKVIKKEKEETMMKNEEEERNNNNNNNNNSNSNNNSNNKTSEKDSLSSDDIIQTLPPPYFISDPNIYDQTELDNVSPIDPGSYVATQPFVIPECVKRPPAVDKSRDVGYITPGVTRAIFKSRWEGITLGGGNNNNGNNNNN